MKKLVSFLLVAISFSTMVFAQDYRVHKVKPGETIAEIAQKYNVTKEAIYKLNPDAKGGKITSAVLVIPFGETPDGVSGSSVVHFKNYEVKAKETLYSIAKENNVSVEDLRKYNAYLLKEELKEGDVIRIPVFSTKKVVNYNETLQTSTFKNLVHIVLPKEGKYGIAKKYGMSVEELEKMNPDMGVLQPGQILKVSNPVAENKAILQADYKFYEVQPKETYYSLTRRFEISRDSLVKLNPILKEEGLQAGMTLRLPKQQTPTTVMAMENSQVLNLQQHIVNHKPKHVSILLPFNLHKFKGDSIDKPAILKRDKILQISLDFYSGVMAAIDSIGKLGVPVQARVFDTQQNTSKVNEIIAQNSFEETQLIIGPLLSSTLEVAHRNQKLMNIPLLSPLTSTTFNTSNFFQTRPADEVMENLMIAYIDSLKLEKNLIILADSTHRRIKQKLLTKFPNARVVKQAKKEYLQREDLVKLLDKTKENWVILETDDYGIISNATSYLNALLPDYDGKIRVFTSEKSKPYEDEVSNQYLSNLKFTYASITKEPEDEADNSFVKTYVKNYGILPSKYAVRGFDLTFDALLRLSLGEEAIQNMATEGTSEYIENKFSYHKRPEGSYYNTAAYLIEYGEGLHLKVLN